MKAETANNKGGMSWPNNHLSRIGILLIIFKKNLILFLYIILIQSTCNDIHEVRKLMNYANNKY